MLQGKASHINLEKSSRLYSTAKAAETSEKSGADR
jgi:hypothetical protein